MLAWFRRKVARKLTLSFCFIAGLAVFLTGWLFDHAAYRHLENQLISHLLTHAKLIESQLTPASFAKSTSNQVLISNLSKTGSIRVTLIDTQGIVTADSNVNQIDLPTVENHAARFEVAEALAGREAHSIRRSKTIGIDYLYAAVPCVQSGRVFGVARVAIPLTELQAKNREIRGQMMMLLIGLILLAFFLATLVSHSINRPIGEMAQMAKRIADGNYEARVTSLASDEQGKLGLALNHLAQRIQSTIKELMDDKMQLGAILSTMAEAVVAVDSHGRILAFNTALSDLFNVREHESRGKLFIEVLRHSQLDQLVRNALINNKGLLDEVHTFTPEERIFEAHAVPLRTQDQGVGAVLVLHDITRLRKLEQVRREFVANVSHELRTPLASIKGYAETLREGAIEDTKNRMDFVQSIERQAERMVLLVDDLLDLSRIESGKKVPLKEAFNLKELVDEIVSDLKSVAKRRTIALKNAVPAVSIVTADRVQIRQVLINLIENAIKFNKEKGSVTIDADSLDGGIAVSITDTGVGIPESDRPHVFERFYRVDKARSRELGGTGLGLSIVKHLIESHGGTVRVESVLGQGSTFIFTLPR